MESKDIIARTPLTTVHETYKDGKLRQRITIGQGEPGDFFGQNYLQEWFEEEDDISRED